MNEIEVKIHFLGAAGTVTGSKFVLQTPEANILIDCGAFQGLKELRENNWMPLDFPAEEIDLVLLTHGHLDHTGYLPRLTSDRKSTRLNSSHVKISYAVFCLQKTKNLLSYCTVMLYFFDDFP